MLCYGLVDYFKIKYGRLIVLSIFLSLFLIFFPIYFKIDDEKQKTSLICIYNAFAYFEIYWNIGLTLVLSSHFVYYYLINRKPKST
ncbi:Uncharacterised protein [Flavobacterium hibernum]|nr:Uncharacterised protein [Flavobacterium hibernum]